MVLLFIWFEDTSKEAGFIFMIRFLQEAHNIDEIEKLVYRPELL
jgi:hypothetical protein